MTRTILTFFLFPFFIFPCFISPLTLLAQDDEYVSQDYLRYEDRTYHPNIRSVEFGVRNVRLSLPVIALGGGEILELSFDDLHAEYEDYTYTIIHCDRNWNPTDIPQNEYLDGFLEQNVMNYDFSLNTVQRYIHYSLSLPDNNFRIKISGNYVLLVYRDFDRQQPVITRRFRVYENLVQINAQVRIPMIINQRQTHHQIDVEVLHPDFDINNPMRDMALHIQQNYRWDNMKTDLKPIFIRNGQITYDNMGGVMFEGGNEFRWIDTRSLRYQPENVSGIIYDPDSMMNHVFLIPDKVLSKERYSLVPDINGAFYIDVREGFDAETDADYAMVHFQLKYPEPFMSGGIYLYGGLTEWQIKPRYRLDYNYRDGLYETQAFLKQGYYNYQYIYLPDGETQGTTEETEGSFFAARQIYTFYIYHQQMGQRYDRLIGHAIIASIN